MSKTGKKKTPADMPPTSMNKYERDRLLNIEANKKKMESLNIKRIAASMTSLVDSTNQKKKKGKKRKIADEDEDYTTEFGEDVQHSDKECENGADIVTKTKKKAETKDRRKRSQFIPPLSLANFLKMNNKQRREVMGNEALQSVSSALKVVQQAIDSQQHIGLNQDINQDVDSDDSDDINNEEFNQFMAMEREDDECQYDTDDEFIQMDKETEQTPQEEQGEGGSDEHDMDEDAIWDKEVQGQLSGPKEIIHMDNENITSGNVKKTRGPVYCRKLTALAPGEKTFVEFDNDGNPIGKYATTYAYFLGDQISNRTVCPVQVDGWEDFKTEILDHLWRCILEICDFDNPELRREVVMKHARSLFRGRRYKLKQKYIVEPKLTKKEEKLNNRPKDMLKAN
ncbi:uncharacterized protein LOC141633633 isoform X2 [Silene latifolia]|uniref:uncharacterized protein LOC141633633 isoform X2 n=1 Tax=Silene latifolia TaxID=37657 RepID=UPI003D776A7B